MSPVQVTEGAGPVILAFPHVGTWVPKTIAATLNQQGLRLTDTDWHVDRLYGGLLPDATSVRANFHRYVVDANRPPDGQSLYPGQATTDLVPLTDFDGNPIWRVPPRDIEDRVAGFHAPYHAALDEQMQRVRARHGVAILYDCHSIRPEIPRLFEGVLPDFNIGTNNGQTCAPAVEDAVGEIVAASDNFTFVANGRFKGGWTTRHYGRPDEGWHAIQMELSQSTHLADPPEAGTYHRDKADRLRPILADILTRLEALAPSLRRPR